MHVSTWQSGCLFIGEPVPKSHHGSPLWYRNDEQLDTTAGSLDRDMSAAAWGKSEVLVIPKQSPCHEPHDPTTQPKRGPLEKLLLPGIAVDRDFVNY